jgi:hypothetical protein
MLKYSSTPEKKQKDTVHWITSSTPKLALKTIN